MTTAAIYVRVSTPGQEQDGSSLDTQLERCCAYAAGRGYTVDEAHIYAETWTGTELWQRPQLSAARRALRDGAVNVLVAFTSDRLSRDQDHLVYLFTEAQQAGAGIEFAGEDFDNGPTGGLVRYVSGWAASWEHRRITARTQDGRIARVRKAGKPLPGPRVKYGYRRVTDEELATTKDDTVKASGLGIDEAHAPIVRRIYERSLAGVAVRSIARELTEAGVPSRTGKAAWTVGTVWEILKDEMYSGTFRAFARTRYTPKSPVYQRPDPITLTVPAIVDRATFDAVQQRLILNKQDSPRNNPHAADYLLRGMVICGHTGRHMTAVMVDGRYPSYRCQPRDGQPGACTTHSVAAGLLDEYVWKQVSETLSHPERIAAHLRALIDDDPTGEDLAPVEAAIIETERALRQFAELIAEETIASLRASHRARYAELEAQHQRQLAEREAILARRAAWEQAIAEVADLEAWCGSIQADLATMDRAERRKRLQQLQVQAHVSRGNGRKVALERRCQITAAIPEFGPLLSGSSTPCER